MRLYNIYYVYWETNELLISLTSESKAKKIMKLLGKNKNRRGFFELEEIEADSAEAASVSRCLLPSEISKVRAIITGPRKRGFII